MPFLQGVSVLVTESSDFLTVENRQVRKSRITYAVLDDFSGTTRRLMQIATDYENTKVYVLVDGDPLLTWFEQLKDDPDFVSVHARTTGQTFVIRVTAVETIIREAKLVKIAFGGRLLSVPETDATEFCENLLRASQSKQEPHCDLGTFMTSIEQIHEQRAAVLFDYAEKILGHATTLDQMYLVRSLSPVVFIVSWALTLLLMLVCGLLGLSSPAWQSAGWIVAPFIVVCLYTALSSLLVRFARRYHNWWQAVNSSTNSDQGANTDAS
jgi:hypothetical protein